MNSYKEEIDAAVFAILETLMELQNEGTDQHKTQFNDIIKRMKPNKVFWHLLNSYKLALNQEEYLRCKILKKELIHFIY